MSRISIRRGKNNDSESIKNMEYGQPAENVQFSLDLCIFSICSICVSIAGYVARGFVLWNSNKKIRTALTAALLRKETSSGFMLSPTGVLRWSVTITHMVASHNKSPADVGADLSYFNHVIHALLIQFRLKYGTLFLQSPCLCLIRMIFVKFTF